MGTNEAFPEESEYPEVITGSRHFDVTENRPRIPAFDEDEDPWIDASPEQDALFGPVARKTMLVIAVVLLIIIGVAVIFLHPLTILPFAFVVFVIYSYRQMSVNHYHSKK